MKKLLFLALMLISMTLCYGTEKQNNCIVNPFGTSEFGTKPFSQITFHHLAWSPGSPWSILFEVSIDEPNPVDYRVVVGVWMYINGFYGCGAPRNCFGWHWQYRYYSVILYAGQTYTNTYVGGGYWPVNSGEYVDNNNYFISFYGPN